MDSHNQEEKVELVNTNRKRLTPNKSCIVPGCNSKADRFDQKCGIHSKYTKNRCINCKKKFSTKKSLYCESCRNRISYHYNDGWEDEEENTEILPQLKKRKTTQIE